MESRQKKIAGALRKIGFYIPFTWHFVVFCIAGIIAYKWLHNKADVPESAFRDIFNLLIVLVLWFCAIIVGLGLLAVLISFIFFSWKKKKTGVDFRIDVPGSGEQSESKQIIRIHVRPVLKPFLGFIKLRLNYDKTRYSEKFHLVKESSKKLFSTSLKGSYTWRLPEIKEYRVESAIVYFEDFFQFFSIASKVETISTFHTRPVEQEHQLINALPRKTEDTSTRIEELRKVEGEYVNYKNFESNDDVRRIVWKIYAKNKELVVRIPEIMDPYASHIYLYVSFYSKFIVHNNDVIDIPFLNYYKNICWSVYKQLSNKGFELRYIRDQDIPQNYQHNGDDQIKYEFSVSKWQDQNQLKEYIKLKDASVIIISSLSDPDEVKGLIDSHGNEISFVLVKLTECMKGSQIVDWIKWFFVQQEKDNAEKYKTSWSLSLLRKSIEENEAKLESVLEKYQKSTIIRKQA